jgi:hypothetical protein
MSRVTRIVRPIVRPERYFLVAILSGGVSVLSLLAALLSANAASQRNLGVAQVVKLMSYSAALERSELAVIHCVAITGLAAGIAGCVTALALYIRS